MENNNINQAEFESAHHKMQNDLVMHVWKNEHLRDEIIRNPKATIERELGVKLDDRFKINVVSHKDPNELTFVLPANIHEAAGRQLSDDELEEVAGGFDDWKPVNREHRFRKVRPR